MGGMLDPRTAQLAREATLGGTGLGIGDSHGGFGFDCYAGGAMSPMAAMSTAPGRERGPRKLILCFDGTGNKFHGDESDSNILKIFRMLDRTAGDQYHYYQREFGGPRRARAHADEGAGSGHRHVRRVQVAVAHGRAGARAVVVPKGQGLGRGLVV